MNETLQMVKIRSSKEREGEFSSFWNRFLYWNLFLAMFSPNLILLSSSGEQRRFGISLGQMMYQNPSWSLAFRVFFIG